ncbi:hypothetical protein ACOMHN_059706 [Nucella lapillus]
MDLTPVHIITHRTLSPTRQEKPRPLIVQRSDTRAHQYPQDTVINRPRESQTTHRPVQGSDPRAHQYPQDTVTNTPREAPATHRQEI